MKALKYFLAMLILGISFSCQKDSGLTTEQIIEGLKEALRVGTENSVTSANQTDGYFGNLEIKIPFPQDAQFVETAVAAIPVVGQTLIDQLILKVNRAAEDAADEAKHILLDAIVNITIEDAVNILNGADDAATQYLKTHTYDQLKAAFKPNINTSLNSVGAAQAWTSVTDAYNALPVHDPVNTDLADYATGKALDGLFVLVAKEEAKIRKDPGARVTDILKTVFGGQ
jgi:hypothetical protein